jgi:hypothetical protein
MPFRNSLIRQYFSVTERQKITPKPFCDFRVFIISTVPLPLFPYDQFKQILDKLEYTFGSVRFAREGGKKQLGTTIFFIEGREPNEPIDADESRKLLEATGIRAVLNELYRQAIFWKYSPVVYNERDIRTIEVDVGTDENWRAWKRKYIDNFTDDIENLSKEEFQRVTGREG